MCRKSVIVINGYDSLLPYTPRIQLPLIPLHYGDTTSSICSSSSRLLLLPGVTVSRQRRGLVSRTRTDTYAMDRKQRLQQNMRKELDSRRSEPGSRLNYNQRDRERPTHRSQERDRERLVNRSQERERERAGTRSRDNSVGYLHDEEDNNRHTDPKMRQINYVKRRNDNITQHADHVSRNLNHVKHRTDHVPRKNDHVRHRTDPAVRKADKTSSPPRTFGYLSNSVSQNYITNYKASLREKARKLQYMFGDHKLANPSVVITDQPPSPPLLKQMKQGADKRRSQKPQKPDMPSISSQSITQCWVTPFSNDHDSKDKKPKPTLNNDHVISRAKLDDHDSRNNLHNDIPDTTFTIYDSASDWANDWGSDIDSNMSIKSHPQGQRKRRRRRKRHETLGSVMDERRMVDLVERQKLKVESFMQYNPDNK